MLAKILGVALIVLGGFGTLALILPLIGSLIGQAFLLVRLAGALLMLYIGIRLLRRDEDY